MKKWVEPRIEVEEFVANEYVAACSDPGTTTYKFVCDAESGAIFKDGGAVYLESNGESGLQLIIVNPNPDNRLGDYHPCGDPHTVTVPKGTNVDNIFQDGYLWSFTGGTKKVKVWTDNGTNIHCSANLNASDYVPVKS